MPINLTPGGEAIKAGHEHIEQEQVDVEALIDNAAKRLLTVSSPDAAITRATQQERDARQQNWVIVGDEDGLPMG